MRIIRTKNYEEMSRKTAALIALLAAFAALVVSGALTFILYQHWQFLMPA